MAIPYGRPNFPPVAGPVKETRMAPEDQLTLEQVENLKNLPDQFKKGYSTTEFWQSAVSTLIPVGAFAAAVFGVDVDTEVLLLSLSGLVPNLGYVFSRAWLKRKRIDGMTGGNVN